jgi:hypothetical protein
MISELAERSIVRSRREKSEPEARAPGYTVFSAKIGIKHVRGSRRG